MATTIKLETLKDCLQFMQWLKNKSHIQNQAANHLHGLIKSNYNNGGISSKQIQSALNAFLGRVSTFYTRLCHSATPGNYVRVNAAKVTDALIRCLPKFFAAIYYLWYCVNPTFEKLGGGGWQKDWPGYGGPNWLGHDYGGDLDRYLRSNDPAQYGGMIPGGFNHGDVKYHSTSGYYQGYNMAEHLENILKKDIHNRNYFRDVFVTSVLSDSGIHTANTGNAVALVGTFCDIVMAERTTGGGQLIVKLNDGLHKQVKSRDKFICWTDLRSHCANLKTQFHKLFKSKRFSHTGQSQDLKHLISNEFASNTADWLRTNLTNVRGKLNKIETRESTLKQYESNLGGYFTHNFFPYGFIFDGNRYVITQRDVQELRKDWRDVIGEFFKSSGGLERLREILEGNYTASCPNPEPPPATSPKPTKEVAPDKKASPPTDTKTTKTQVMQPKNGRADGTPNQGDKGRGANNQGSRNSAASNQNNGQHDAKSTTSSVVTSSSSLPPGGAGASGEAGPQDNKGPQGPPAPKQTSQVQTSQSNVKQQNHQSPPQPATPPQAPAPSPPAAPVAPSQSGGGDKSPNGGGGAGKKAAASPALKPQTPSGTSSRPQSSVVPAPGGVPSTGSGQGLPGAVQPGGNGRGSAGGDTRSSQPVVTSQSVTTQSTSGTNQVTSSPVATGNGGGSGPGDLVSASNTSGPGSQGSAALQDDGSSTSADTFSNSGGGKSGAGGSNGTGDTKAVGPELDERLKVYENKLKEKRDRDEKNMRAILIKFNENLQQIEKQKIQQQMQNDLQRQLLANIPSTNLRLNENIAGPTGGRSLNWRHPYDPKNLTRRIQAVNRLQPHALDGRGVWNKSPSDLYIEKRREEWERQCEEEQRKKDQTYNDTILHLKSRQNVDKERIQLSQKQHEQTVLDSLQSMQQIEHENAKIISVATGLDGEPADPFDVKEVSDVDHEVVSDSQRTVNIDGQEVHDAEDFLKRQKKDAEQIRSEAQLIASLYDRQQQTLLNGNEVLEPFNVEEELFQPVAQSDVDRYKPNGDISTEISNMPDVGMTGHAITSPPEVEVKIQSVPVKPEGLPDPILPDFDISIDIPERLVPEALEEYDYGPSNRLPPALGGDKQDANIFDPPRLASERGIPLFANPHVCQNLWSVTPSYTYPTAITPSPPPTSDNMPPPKTVREMLYWFVGLNQYELIGVISEHVKNILVESNKGVSKSPYAIEVTGDFTELDASLVTQRLTETCLYSATVIYRIKHRDDYTTYKDFNFKSVYSQLHYSPDPAALLCQLRDYVYACCHQLEFLKAQCKRDKLSGGWSNYDYGSDLKTSSPLQAFLTDGWDSAFETHLFDPCNLCHKSRIRMGFRMEDLPKTSQLGSVISTILTPSCGGNDPLLTLASYLNCLTKRTPRTTGELVSYFHHFGNELHGYVSGLSSLGESLSKPHPDCPDWDHLDGSGLDTVRGIRGSETLNVISKHNHDNDHLRTLSTLVGCGSDPTTCQPRMSPITYRAYALYSQSFAHTYLSWTVYLPDRLWESLLKLHYDLQKHRGSGKCSSLHLCSTAPPLLYTHGITPPEGGPQQTLTCSDVISKLKDVITGKPIASLMSAMDDFLYGIREPFIFTLVALWSLAFLIFANTMLYRLDVLYIRSHLIRTKASHVIDVKALLTDGKKMMSLYDANYFDEDPIGQLGI